MSFAMCGKQRSGMMKGVILKKGFAYFTCMDEILAPLREDVLKHNWLIADCECNWYPDPRLLEEYWLLTGKELLDLVETNDLQFIWAVFSAFSPGISLERILAHPLPYADGYREFWKNPVTMQHPLAVIEIVAWDSSLALCISRSDEIIRKFTEAFPLCEDLEEDNRRNISEGKEYY